MDTLAKETMGLPIFICPSSNTIISSGSSNNTNTSSAHHSKSVSISASASTTTSPTTPFFTTTRSPVSPTLPLTSTPFTQPNTPQSNSARNPRRNTYTYTPPTFSPRRESLLSTHTHRLSQVFESAAALASDVWTKAADQVFGQEDRGTGESGWGGDLEAGDGVRQGRSRDGQRGGDGERNSHQRFGEEGAFESWLD